MTSLSSLARRPILALLAAAMLFPALQAAESTSDDPAAQAEAYSKEATELRADAAKHEKIAKMHSAGAGGPNTAHRSIALHCERLATQLRAAAEESDSIAAAYRSLAETK